MMAADKSGLEENGTLYENVNIPTLALTDFKKQKGKVQRIQSHPLETIYSHREDQDAEYARYYSLSEQEDQVEEKKQSGREPESQATSMQETDRKPQITVPERPEEERQLINQRIAQIINGVSNDTLDIFKETVAEQALERAPSISALDSDHGSSLNFNSQSKRQKSYFRNDIYQNSLKFQNRLLSGKNHKTMHNTYQTERIEPGELRQRSLGDVNNRQTLCMQRSMSNVMLHDDFITKKKMEPATWFDDERTSKDKTLVVDDIKLAQQSYKKSLTSVKKIDQHLKVDDSLPVRISTYNFLLPPPKRTSTLSSTSQVQKRDSNISLLYRDKLQTKDKGQQDSDSDSSAAPKNNNSSKDDEREEDLNTETVTSMFATDEEEQMKVVQTLAAQKYYQNLVDQRNALIKKSTLRFSQGDYFNIFKLKTSEESRFRCCSRSGQRRTREELQKELQEVPFSEMNPQMKRERLSYLRYKVKAASLAILFLHQLKLTVQMVQIEKIEKRHQKIIMEQVGTKVSGEEETQSKSLDQFDVLKTIWHCFTSLWLWFNLLTSPIIMLWPDTSDEELNKSFYYLLWFNELVWLLDMARKFFDKPKKSRAADVYENTIIYIKSTFILDLVSSLPQLTSGMSNRFVSFKILRLYQVWLLHYPLETLTNIIFRNKDQKHIFVIVYAWSTICRILMLLHYLAIMWIFVGSATFIDREPGSLPWSLTEDFVDYTNYRLYVFSVYWVCTVVTTVGYGDYAGGTTLEYTYTLLLEGFGIVVFATLQVAVQQVVNLDTSFSGFSSQTMEKINNWLLVLENSNNQGTLPADLYECINQELYFSFMGDFNLIVEEFDFYYRLSPKLQNQLVKHVFKRFLFRFNYIFDDSEQDFSNSLIVHLAYNEAKHGQILQSSMYDCEEVYFIYEGGVAACEPTCFQEPLLVYGPGTVINLYQVLMKKALKFDFKTLSPSSFNSYDNAIVYSQNDEEYFKVNKNNRNVDRDVIQIYSITADYLLELCELFPKTAMILQKHCIRQVEHLRETRMLKQHLHTHNTVNVNYGKNARFFEQRAAAETDLSIEVKRLREYQIEDNTRELLTSVTDVIENLEGVIKDNIQRQLFIRNSQMQRSSKQTQSLDLDSSTGLQTSVEDSVQSQRVPDWKENDKDKDLTKRAKICAVCKKEIQDESDIYGAQSYSKMPKNFCKCIFNQMKMRSEEQVTIKSMSKLYWNQKKLAEPVTTGNDSTAEPQSNTNIISVNNSYRYFQNAEPQQNQEQNTTSLEIARPNNPFASQNLPGGMNRTFNRINRDSSQAQATDNDIFDSHRMKEARQGQNNQTTHRPVTRIQTPQQQLQSQSGQNSVSDHGGGYSYVQTASFNSLNENEQAQEESPSIAETPELSEQNQSSGVLVNSPRQEQNQQVFP